MQAQRDSFKPLLSYEVIHVGSMQTPVLIIDHCCFDPRRWVLKAESEITFSRRRDFYPGVKKDVPPQYIDEVLKPHFSKVLEVFSPNNSGGVVSLENTFSIAQEPPEKLLPIQCIPHFDSPDENHIAAVHYLCNPTFSGTAFYQHRETGFERIGAANMLSYRKTLERQATTVGLPKRQYICGDTELFECIGSVALRFNRIIFYPSNLLHSGNITHRPNPLSAVADKRLTITSSLQISHRNF